jgi:hypothetical protein
VHRPDNNEATHIRSGSAGRGNTRRKRRRARDSGGTVIGRYVPAPSKSGLTMSWLVLLQRTKHAEKAREHARFDLWESEGGSTPHQSTEDTR